MLADAKCNGYKSDRLAFVGHLARWSARNASDSFQDLLIRGGLPESTATTRSVTGWAYSQAERVAAKVWSHGPGGMVPLVSSWRTIAGLEE